MRLKMGYDFGRRSLKEMATLDPRLQEILKHTIKFIDFSVLQGYRDQSIQNRLWHQGFSKLRWPNSKHNKWPSLAVDLSPYPQDWDQSRKAEARFYFLSGHIMASALMLGYKLRWGGDWDNDNDFKDQNFDDLGHFEIGDK